VKCDIFNLYSTKNKNSKMSAKTTAVNLAMSRTGRVSTVVALSLLLLLGTTMPGVRADEFDEQIRALQNQNAEARSNVNALQAQSNSYQDAINRLQAQIDGILAQIAINQAEQARLQDEITKKQAEIDMQKRLLGDGIKAMYVDGQITTIEMLATSNNLSEFVDKEEYRNAVQKNIQESLARIAKLQNELRQKKAQVDQLISDQRAQEAQLAADRSQQADMLAYTEGQKAAFNAQIASNSSRIAELRRQQILANSRYNIGTPGVGANCGGGYPGAAAGPWGTWGCNYQLDNTIDNWGMYNRECVSYTAYKVHADFLAGRNSRDMPYWGGVGNANQWDENAIRAGIPVDSNPTPGSIAISNAGFYGHAMYVEQVGVVNGRQAIYVSEYNAGWDGRYSERWLYTTGLVFLHF
jgi:surface antigen/peptidoglycan hydrolase CwlO-like protein